MTSCCQFLESKHWGRNHMTQSIEEQIGALPAIEAKAHLFEISREMLEADSMPCSHDAALEKREGGFNGVCVNIPVHVATLAVNDGFVILDSGLLHGERVSPEIISENHFHIFADVLSDVFCERAGFRILRVEKAEFTVTLSNTEHSGFIGHAIDDALTAIHAADVGRIHFDLAVHHGLIGLRHCVTDAMAEIPCGLVAHSNSPMDLMGTHALLRFAEQVCSQKPFRKWQVGIVEHGAGGNGELIVAILTVEELFFRFEFYHGSVAAQAARAFGPAQTDKQGAALLFGGEQGVYIH